jgi:hypothetical protein
VSTGWEGNTAAAVREWYVMIRCVHWLGGKYCCCQGAVCDDTLCPLVGREILLQLSGCSGSSGSSSSSTSIVVLAAGAVAVVVLAVLVVVVVVVVEVVVVAAGAVVVVVLAEQE